MSLEIERALAMPALHEGRGINGESRGRMVLRSASMRLALVLVMCCPTWASAQDSVATRDSTTRREGWIVGPLVGMPTVGGEPSAEGFTLGLGFTSVDPGRLGADISVGTMPRALASGLLTFGFRSDATFPVSVSPNVLLLPAAGFSVIGVLGSEAMGGTMGVNAGLAAVIHGASPTGLRVGVTVHQFAGAEVSVFLIEVGVVHVPAFRRAGGT